MKYSVIIATYLRPEELRKTLQTLSQTLTRESNTEVIVVDNGDQEEVERIVSSFKSDFGAIRYLRESRLGLIYARNCGIDESSGEWLIFLDDDVDVSADWFKSYRAVTEDGADRMVVGGRVIPKFTADPPRWLSEDLYPALSIMDYPGGAMARVYQFPYEYPGGGNVAIRREILTAYQGFDAHFGRKGTALISGEETFLFYLIDYTGIPLWYCAEALVSHRIPETRMRKSFFRRRFFGDGRTQALLFTLMKRRGVNTRTSREYLKGIARAIADAIVGRSSLFMLQLRLIELSGFIFQRLALANDRTRR